VAVEQTNSGSFAEVFENAPLERYRSLALGADAADVERALCAERVGLEEFLALISPAAAQYLEPLAARAMRVTRERFGRAVTLYVPLYVSNVCVNRCVYCGFNRDNRINRVTLSEEEVFAEAEALYKEGFRHLLLVSGEAPNAVPPRQMAALAGKLHKLFPSISVEIYPMSVEEYSWLVEAGVEGLTVYQETYDREVYERVHPGGKKADYDWRLATPERGGEAGLRRIGIGSLLGLTPWRDEAVALALHADWLQRRFWRTSVSISFPRLREAAGGFQPDHPMSDAELLQMACALRLFLPDAGLILSTRENAAFRDGITPICITMMSAGSRTEPGGYTKPGEAEKQFSIEDERTPEEVARMLDAKGLEPVWKDWDSAFTDDHARK
jgi:2-iminoacetate synthase